MRRPAAARVESGTAGDVRSIAEELRSQGKDTPANLAEQVASQAGPDSLYVEAQPYHAGAATATALTSVPPTPGRTTPSRPP